MNIRDATSPSELDQVARAFEEVLKTIPPGCASLRQREESKEAPAEVAIVPANETSAEFGAMFFDGHLYGAFFGRKPFFTTYESPWELRLRRSDGLDKHVAVLKKMCEAVAAGRCDHLITLFSVSGTIRVDDGNVFRVLDIPIFHPRRLRKRIIYEPYYGGARTADSPFRDGRNNPNFG